MQSYKNILIAIDGSKGADTAFEKSVAVAERNNSTLTIAHIIDTRAFQPYEAFDTTVTDSAHNEARKTLDACEKYAKEHGVTDVKTVLEFGSPKVQLSSDIPKNENIDLIMLGATGLSAVERFIVGSVSEYVIRNAPCDVLVVKTNVDNTPVISDGKEN